MVENKLPCLLAGDLVLTPICMQIQPLPNPCCPTHITSEFYITNDFLSQEELSQGLKTLTEILSSYGVEFGVIGRLFKGIDIIITPDKFDAEKLSNKLCADHSDLFTTTFQYGVMIPAIRVPRGNQQVVAEVEIFDILVWPRRLQYDFRNPDNDGITVNIDNVIRVPITRFFNGCCKKKFCLVRHFGQRKGVNRRR